jgi:hypothetical protein
MNNTRDASLGAGVQSGTSSKEKIGGSKGVLPGKSLPDGVGGAWSKTKSEGASRGHKFKNG